MRLYFLLQADASRAVSVQPVSPVRQLTIEDMKRLTCQNACSSDSADMGRPTLSGFAVYAVHSEVKISPHNQLTNYWLCYVKQRANWPKYLMVWVTEYHVTK